MGEGAVFNHAFLCMDATSQIVGEGTVQQVGVRQQVAAAETSVAVVSVLHGDAVE